MKHILFLAALPRFSPGVELGINKKSWENSELGELLWLVFILFAVFAIDLLLLYKLRLNKFSLNIDVPNSVDVTKSVANSGIIGRPSEPQEGSVCLP